MKLNQVTLSCTDLDKSISFYKLLGLELIVYSADKYARFLCPYGDSTFSLHVVEEIHDNTGVWVYFECDDLDKTVAYLESNSIVFESAIKDQPWLWREAHLLDPDNNRIILYYAGENRINPPWRIKN